MPEFYSVGFRYGNVSAMANAIVYGVASANPAQTFCAMASYRPGLDVTRINPAVAPADMETCLTSSRKFGDNPIKFALPYFGKMLTSLFALDVVANGGDATAEIVAKYCALRVAQLDCDMPFVLYRTEEDPRLQWIAGASHKPITPEEWYGEYLA